MLGQAAANNAMQPTAQQRCLQPQDLAVAMLSARRLMAGVGRSQLMERKMNSFAISILVSLLCSFALVTPSHAQSLEGQQTGKVQFNVIMPNDILIPFLSGIVEGENFKKEIPLTVDDIEAKANLIELPVGIYRISSRNGNYYPFQRAPFRVQAGTVTKINVFPLIRVRMQMLMADGSDKYQFAPEPKYDSFSVPNSPNAVLTLLIRYDERQKRKKFVEYSSKVWESRGSPEAVSRGVMVSYDALAIYADKVRFDKENYIFEAEGNAVVEVEQQRIKANKVTIKLKNGVPEIIRN